MIEIGATVEQWILERLLINGSFVTAKHDLEDVDGAILVKQDFRQRRQQKDPAASRLWEIYESQQPDQLFICEREMDWWEWYRFFSCTKDERQPYKGLVEVKL